MMTFGGALERLRDRQRVRRTGWNGKGMWVRLVDLHTDAEFRVREIEPCVGTWSEFLVMKTADGKLVPWLASQTDILACDWETLP